LPSLSQKKEAFAMKTAYGLWLVLGVFALVLAGCHKDGKPDKEPADYPIKGKVVAVNLDKQTVRIDHEDIPGAMQAMTMDFDVEDRKLLKGLKPGDKVEGRVKKDAGKFIITELKKR
jgi:protein SCO1/2